MGVRFTLHRDVVVLATIPSCETHEQVPFTRQEGLHKPKLEKEKTEENPRMQIRQIRLSIPELWRTGGQIGWGVPEFVFSG